MKSKYALLVAASVSAFANPSWAFTGEVVRVLDGDTVEILRDDVRLPVRVRLASIDAPEKGMPFGQAAKKALSDLVFGKDVDVESRGVDSYGRTIGIISTDSVNVNAAMVSGGYAWAYCETPQTPKKCKYLDARDRDKFLSAMQEAKDAKSNLWSQDNPQAPWKWRREQKGEGLQNARCSDFETCDAAKAALAAGNKNIDGNHDGVPCEALCR